MGIAVILAVVLVSIPQADDSFAAGADSSSVVDSIIAQAISYLGVPYVYGGTDENGFDCSGLAYRVFNDNGVELPRTVTAIGEMGVAVSRDSLQPGDLLIFHDPTHTGIYIGDGEFIHCSSWQDRGVVITEITQSNYARRYFAARRVITE
jgi:cell wall-associated NlpC family hydrolase